MSNDEELANDLSSTDSPHLTTGARLTLHEQICGLRWKAILSRMGRLEGVMLACAGTLICGMAGVILTLAMHK